MGRSNSSLSPPHVVIFPFLAQGHTLPLLDFSKLLTSRALKVTIITTPLNAPFILSKISTNPSICLSIIPFPKVQTLPEGCENVANLPSMDLFGPFIMALEKLQKPFEDILTEMSNANNTPICVISDTFLYWTLDSCRSFDIPRIVFNGMGVLPLAIIRSGPMHVPCMTDLSPTKDVRLPELRLPFPVQKTDFPNQLWEEPNIAFLDLIARFTEGDRNSWGAIANSFEEMEGDYVSAFESLHNKDAKAWLVGPLLLSRDDQDQFNVNDEKQDFFSYIKWLDKKVGSSSVIYVSFGSQSDLSEAQMEELAFGLEMAGEPFIWVIRSRTWAPPVGWEERVKGLGLVARDWVDQRSILAHPAIGGFLSHCGWNSVIEGLTMGVPILTWPLGADQLLNAKFVAMNLKAGIMVPQERDEDEKILTVHRDVIYDRIKELMRGEEGSKVRERARELGRKARQAMEKGGSSYKKLDELIECLTLNRKPSNAN